MKNLILTVCTMLGLAAVPMAAVASDHFAPPDAVMIIDTSVEVVPVSLTVPDVLDRDLNMQMISVDAANLKLEGAAHGVQLDGLASVLPDFALSGGDGSAT